MATPDEPLDNPLWSSLTTLHRPLARGTDGLLRYPADVAPFLATASPANRSDAELAELVDADETVFLIGPRPSASRTWRVDDLGTILQMVCAGGGPCPPASLSGGPCPPAPPNTGQPIVALGADHQPGVLGLAALVYPHYFRPRTTELGRYFGIYDGPTLVAMIGERMGMPGYREISAVCTHPDFTGRGLARRLLGFLTNDIAARGETAFLHVSPGNRRAVELYELNGYRTRTAIAFGSLRRA